VHSPIDQSGASLPALTSIRFFAAITVVVSHYSELGLLNLPSQIFDFVDGGRPAVSLFFVLPACLLGTVLFRIILDGWSKIGAKVK